MVMKGDAMRALCCAEVRIKDYDIKCEFVSGTQVMMNRGRIVIAQCGEINPTI
jgi:hypothetical protein